MGKVLMPPEVARMLGVTMRGLYQLVQDKRIPHHRLNGGPRGRLRFTEEGVRQYLLENRVSPLEER